VKYRQMDFEYTFWFLLQLLKSPRTAYRQTTFNKQTKNQWARDDPAMVVVLSGLVAAAALAYCAALGGGVLGTLWAVLNAVLVDFLLGGMAIATACWFLANRYLRTAGHSHAVEQSVEWMYAFDVHCNSFFPMFLVLYVGQFFLLPLVLTQGFAAALVANLLYAVGLAYYHYMNFQGYSALPFLERTEVFLFPIGLIAVGLPLCIVTGFNPARFTLGFYFE